MELDFQYDESKVWGLKLHLVYYYLGYKFIDTANDIETSTVFT